MGAHDDKYHMHTMRNYLKKLNTIHRFCRQVAAVTATVTLKTVPLSLSLRR